MKERTLFQVAVKKEGVERPGRRSISVNLLPNVLLWKLFTRLLAPSRMRRVTVLNNPTPGRTEKRCRIHPIKL